MPPIAASKSYAAASFEMCLPGRCSIRLHRISNSPKTHPAGSIPSRGMRCEVRSLRLIEVRARRALIGRRSSGPGIVRGVDVVNPLRRIHRSRRVAQTQKLRGIKPARRLRARGVRIIAGRHLLPEAALAVRAIRRSQGSALVAALAAWAVSGLYGVSRRKTTAARAIRGGIARCITSRPGPFGSGLIRGGLVAAAAGNRIAPFRDLYRLLRTGFGSARNRRRHHPRAKHHESIHFSSP